MDLMKNTWLAVSIVLLAGLCAIICFPIIPVDETRYATVAWEMWINDSFIVPLLNGDNYTHKPPLLFWMIHGLWKLFGVNDLVLRFIPLTFSLANIVLIYILGKSLWPEDSKTAHYASLILATTIWWLVFSPLIRFDMMLSFWVLLGILGIVLAAGNSLARGWVFLSLAIGGGILTKGPVVFAHILPVGLFVFWWNKDKKLSAGWYLKFLVSLFVGTCIGLIWAIPAVIEGGEEYGNQILWNQTADRVVLSTSHRQPFWWYLPLLPLLFFPWFFLKSTWGGLTSVTGDRGMRFIVVWFLSALVVFSLISGKQLQYLLPVVPALALLAAKGFSGLEVAGKKARDNIIAGLLYALTGIAFLLIDFFQIGADRGAEFMMMARVIGTGALIISLALLLARAPDTGAMVRTVALSSLAFFFVLIFGLQYLGPRYDLVLVAGLAESSQRQGKVVAHIGKYHGQYQFLGRLREPLVVLKDDNDVIGRFLFRHSNSVVIDYVERAEEIPVESVIYQQAYRGKKVVLWRPGGLEQYLLKD